MTIRTCRHHFLFFYDEMSKNHAEKVVYRTKSKRDVIKMSGARLEVVFPEFVSLDSWKQRQHSESVSKLVEAVAM